MAEIRLFRLTWNTNGWEFPMGHGFKRQSKYNSNMAWEKQYGWGGEEWLFNPRYRNKGYQYGYIRGAMDLNPAVLVIDTAYLFTFNTATGERFLIGKIKNLEIIHQGSQLSEFGRSIIAAHRADMIKELNEVCADSSVFSLPATVRFKVEDGRLYDEMIPVPGLAGQKYNRFIPYIVDDSLLQILEGGIQPGLFQFKPGIAKNKGKFDRSTSEAKKAVIRLHGQVTDDLAKYLQPEFSNERQNISVEKTRFGENIADVVLQHGDKTYTILEVKTSGNQRRNIRDAVGQLLDYALWHEDMRIRELIAVAPTSPGPEEKAQLIRICHKLSIPLRFWYYREGEKQIKDRFVKIL